MFVTLGEGWQGFGLKQPAGLTPKVENIIPRSPIALEGMPPTDGLLAGIVQPSHTLEGSLRNADVAHIGNMEDEGLNIERDWLLYSISLPRASYFLVVLPEDCRSNIVGPDRARKRA